MSGGSYAYAYRRVEELAQSIHGDSPERRAFRVHLVKVAKALHDIEWVDSCDYGNGDEVAAINACLQPGDTVAAMREALAIEVAAAQKLLETLQ